MTTSVTFYKGIPFDDTYKDVMMWNSDTEKNSFFTSYAVKSDIDYNYVSENVIGAEATIKELYLVNYCKFNNINNENKTVYAFVNSVEYVNPNYVEVNYTIDVWNTYYSDFRLGECNVLYEHAGKQTFADIKQKYLVPESINFGEPDYIINTEIVETFKNDNGRFIVESTIDLSQRFGDIDAPNLVNATGCWIGGVYNATNMYLVGYDAQGTSIQEILDELQGYPWIGQGIVGIFYVPDAFETKDFVMHEIVVNQNSNVLMQIDELHFSETQVYDSKVSDKFGTVKHLKLLTYPYSVIEITDFTGNKLDVYIEKLPSDNLRIRKNNGFDHGAQLLYYVGAYGSNVNTANKGEFYNFSIFENNFPSMSTFNSMNDLAVAQGKESNRLSTISHNFNSMLSLVGSLMTGNIIFGGGSAVESLIVGNERLSFERNQLDTRTGNKNNSSTGSYFNINQANSGVYLRFKTLPPQMLKQAEQRFTRYGYATNMIKVPEINNMSRYNYVECSKAVISGDIPTNARRKLCEVFEKGVTLWHTMADFRRYGINDAV